MHQGSRLRYIPVLVLSPWIACVSGSRTAVAQDQAPPCPAYAIEGTIGSPTVEGGQTVRTASVYVHASDDPMPSHQVIATFADASGASIGEPAVLITDAGGRAEVAVPPTAESVNFVAETLDAPGCGTGDESDPRVLLEIVPVGASEPDSPAPPGPDGALARTGPFSEVVALASLLLLAFGAAVGTGRGRRRAIAAADAGAKRGIPR